MGEEQTKELVQDILSRRYLKKVNREKKDTIDDLSKRVDKEYREDLIRLKD